MRTFFFFLASVIMFHYSSTTYSVKDPVASTTGDTTWYSLSDSLSITADTLGDSIKFSMRPQYYGLATMDVQYITTDTLTDTVFIYMNHKAVETYSIPKGASGKGTFDIYFNLTLPNQINTFTLKPKLKPKARASGKRGFTTFKYIPNYIYQ